MRMKGGKPRTGCVRRPGRRAGLRLLPPRRMLASHIACPVEAAAAAVSMRRRRNKSTQSQAGDTHVPRAPSPAKVVVAAFFSRHQMDKQ